MSSFQHDYVLSRKEQLNVYLANNCRPDGREFDHIKPIAISPGVWMYCTYTQKFKCTHI
jgi:hypothetical protein